MAALQRLRMSWEEYLRLPESAKAEWVDGEVVVRPPVGQPHAFGTARLIAVLVRALPDLDVATEVGVWLPRNRLRAPDIAVVDHRSEGPWVTEPPVLVVEVLSAATRSEDTVRKSGEYAVAGIGQYWLLDPDNRTLDVYGLVDGGWDLLLHLDDATPAGAVTVRGRDVELDLADLLR